jgi:hypothetical protein
MKSIYIALLLLGGCGFAMGQDASHFKYASSLPNVEQAGFYKIMLQPEHTRHANKQLTDIRIFDDTDTEVPYLAQQEKHEQQYSLFRNYEILEEKRVPNSYSAYTVHNAEEKAVNNLTLIIKNAEVKKEMKLLGSQDLQEWSVVKERSLISSINNQQGTSEIKILDFPLSNYRYFRLELSDSLNAPIQITSIGYYEHFSKSGLYQEIKPVAETQANIKKEKTSVINLVFPSQQLIDQLELLTKGPSLYHRNARLEVVKAEGKKVRYQLIKQFSLSSSTPHIVTLGPLKADSLRLVIENEDNPPLQVSVKGWQLNRYLLAYLQPGKAYSLKLGNTQLSAPVYDLQYYRDSIPANAPVLLAGNVKEYTIQPAPESKSIFNSTLYVWIAIVLAAGLLGYVTFNMVKEMDKK